MEESYPFKRVENTAGKGEIARNKQFLLFPHCFQKACFPGASKGVIVWEWVNRSTHNISKLNRFIEWCYTLFQPYHGDSANIHVVPGFPVGWGSKKSYARTLREKDPCVTRT